MSSRGSPSAWLQGATHSTHVSLSASAESIRTGDHGGVRPHLLLLQGRHVDDLLLLVAAAALGVQHVPRCPAGSMCGVDCAAAAWLGPHIGMGLHDVYHVHFVLQAVWACSPVENDIQNKQFINSSSVSSRSIRCRSGGPLLHAART